MSGQWLFWEAKGSYNSHKQYSIATNSLENLKYSWNFLDVKNSWKTEGIGRELCAISGKIL